MASTVRVTRAANTLGVYPIRGNVEGGVPIRAQVLCLRAWGLCGGVWCVCWPREVWGADVVLIEGPSGLRAQHLVWVIGYGPLQRYVGMYETRVPHDRRVANRVRDLLMATLRWL